MAASLAAPSTKPSSSSTLKETTNMKDTLTATTTAAAAAATTATNNNNNSTNGRQQPISSSSTTSNASMECTSQMVARAFVKEYYTVLTQSPMNLPLLYTEASSLTHGVEGDCETTEPARGLQSIRSKIASLDLVDCRVSLTSIDSQESLQGGVVVMAFGFLCIGNEESRKFSQTFVLARQHNGFYLHNDIFRFSRDVEDVADYKSEDVGEEEVTMCSHKSTTTTVDVASVPAPAPASSELETDLDDSKVTEDTVIPVVEGSSVVLLATAPTHNSTSTASLLTDFPPVTDTLATTLKDPSDVTATSWAQRASKPAEVHVQKTNGIAAPPVSTPRSAEPLPSSTNLERRASSHKTPGPSVFVRFLPQGHVESKVRGLFDPFGPIVSFVAPLGKQFVFIEFKDQATVDRILDAVPFTYEGSEIEVQLKRDEPRRSSGGRSSRSGRANVVSTSGSNTNRSGNRGNSDRSSRGSGHNRSTRNSEEARR